MTGVGTRTEMLSHLKRQIDIQLEFYCILEERLGEQSVDNIVERIWSRSFWISSLYHCPFVWRHLIVKINCESDKCNHCERTFIQESLFKSNRMENVLSLNLCLLEQIGFHSPLLLAQIDTRDPITQNQQRGMLQQISYGYQPYYKPFLFVFKTGRI